MGVRYEDVTDIAGLAYEAGAEPARWPAFLERIGDAIGDRTCALIIHDLANQVGSMAFSFRVDPTYESAYAAHYAALNPWTSRGAPQMATGRVLVSEMALPASALRKTEFYDGFLRPHDVMHSLAAVIERTDDVTSYVAVQRSARRGEFTTDDLKLVGIVMPHLQRALALHRKLGALRLREQALVETADRLPWGVLFVDRRGHVVFANVSARALDHTITRRVLAIASRGGGALHRHEKRPLAITVAPLHTTLDVLGVAGATHAVFVVDPEAERDPSEVLLRQTYGLTRTEARITVALVRGESVHDIAEATDTAIATVRTHLKRVFAKTGTSRQAELIRLVLLGDCLQRPARDS